MSKIKGVYSYWCVACFLLTFLFFHPFFWVVVQRKSWHKYSSFLYKIWARVFYFLIGVRVQTVWEFVPQSHQNYIYVANHTSYLDIAAMIMTVPNFSVFMGKASVQKVPLFGYIFKKLHIPVHRSKGSSRYEAFERVKQALDEGKNVLIYPEGGILTQNPPELVPFKDGAFRAAIQKKVPLVPVTILYNWLILPDKQPLVFRRHHCKLIYHKPIETQNLTEDDVVRLKNDTYQLIDKTLKNHIPPKSF